ncbi:AAA family ATPase [Desulfovibrio cuneatus]|uniref:AAA family ATPase n=1 Tax=Desulfovibrio cuneatus TaxID=159728 RepID=UPI00040EBC03|nr:ATP-binding protein [Desulfovibrio cuneatus]
MRDTIIDTAATMRFDGAVDEVLESGTSSSGFILAYGQAGRGKSVAADRNYCARGGAYVRVWTGWSQTAFMQRLLFEVSGTNGDMPRYRANTCKEMVVSLLKKKRQTVFVDEADRLDIDRIEDLRDILDVTRAPVVLIGEEGLLAKLAQRRRIWSRVVHEVEFGPISASEVSVFAMQAAGLDIPAKLCGSIATKAEGDFRLVRNMLILVEKAAKAKGSIVVDAAMLETALAAHSWRRG